MFYLFCFRCFECVFYPLSHLFSSQTDTFILNFQPDNICFSKTNFYDIYVATLAFIWLVFVWYIFWHYLTHNQSRFVYLNFFFNFYRQHMVRACFFTHSDNLCFLIIVFGHLHLMCFSTRLALNLSSCYLFPTSSIILYSFFLIFP